jgi:hypothetical protein
LGFYLLEATNWLGYQEEGKRRNLVEAEICGSVRVLHGTDNRETWLEMDMYIRYGV